MQSAEEFFGTLTPAHRTESGSSAGGNTSPSLPDGSLLPSDPNVSQAITDAAKEYNVAPSLLFALAQQESSYNPDAVGVPTQYGTAKGMFQYLDSTAKSLGIDPLDYKQAARAAAKQLSERLKKGTRWAVGAHFAGDDPKQHGEKTAQYVEDVLAKASVISQQLGDNLYISDPENDSTDTSTTVPSADQFFGKASEPKSKVSTKTQPDNSEESIQQTGTNAVKRAISRGPFDTSDIDVNNPTLSQIFKGVGNELLGPVLDATKRSWQGIKDVLDRQYKEVPLTSPQEIQNEYFDRYGGQIARGFPVPTLSEFSKSNPTKRLLTTSFDDERLKWVQRLRDHPEDINLLPKRFSDLAQTLGPQVDESKFAPANTFKGAFQRFISTAKNPLDSVLRGDVEVVTSYLANAPEFERKHFDETRKRVEQLNIVAHPQDFPQESVTAAQKALDSKVKDPNLKESFTQLMKAAVADPGGTGAALMDTFFQSPELFWVPGGGEIKPLQAIRAARTYRAARLANTATTMTQAGRATRIADAILGYGAADAGINVAAGGAHELAETGDISSESLKTNAALGVALGSMRGGLGELFFRSARAKARLSNPDAERARGTLDDLYSDSAKADVEIDDALSKLHDSIQEGMKDGVYGIGDRETPLQQHLRNIFGIRTPEDAAKAKATYAKQVKDVFKSNSDYADYLQYVAQERLDRAEVAAKAAQAEEARAADPAVIAAARAAQRQKWQDEFDNALAARDQAEMDSLHDKANKLDETKTLLAKQKDEEAATIADRLNSEELLEALYTDDEPTIKQAQARIKRRESVLRTPKWQRGSVSAEDLAKVGLGLGAAAAGSAVAMHYAQENKLANGVFGALAGLSVPAALALSRGSEGSSMLRLFRQAGAIDSNGLSISHYIKNGHLTDKLEEAEVRQRDKVWMDAAKAGNELGLENLYRAYEGDLRRYIKRVLVSRGDRGELDPEDILQESMIRVLDYVRKGGEIDNFPAFVKTTAERIASNANRERTAAKRGSGDEIREGDVTQYDDYEGNERSAPSIYDQAVDNPDYNIEGMKDTPENVAIRNDAMDILRKGISKLNPDERQVFDLQFLQLYPQEEIAQMMKVPLGTVKSLSSRAKAKLEDALASERKTISPVKSPGGKQAGNISPEGFDAVKKTAMLGGIASLGAAGYFLSGGEDPYKAAEWGAAAAVGGVFLGRRQKLSGATHIAEFVRGLDARLMDISPDIHGLAKKHALDELQSIHHFNEQTKDFLGFLSKLPKDIKGTIVEALSTRDKTIINTMLKQVGGDVAVKSFDKVRKVLDDIEDGLVSYGLIKKSEVDYFPFRVKDVQGLKEYLGKQFSDGLDKALSEAEARKGEPLTDIEKDVVTNKFMEPYLGKKLGANTPGFAKARTIQRIPPDLQKFYYDPEETLNSYGQQANKYIQRAKFFGKDLRRVNKEGKEVVSTDLSIGAMTRRLQESGQLTKQKAFELGYLLRTRFGPAEESASRGVQAIKNVGNAALLSNLFSAATQLSDAAVHVARYPRDAALAAVKQVFKKNILDVSDFGLTDHIAHDFITTDWLSKLTKFTLKGGGFRAIDEAMKTFVINTQVERMLRQAQSPKGELALRDEFQSIFPDSFEKALSDLKQGKVTPKVELLAFTRLTDMQPLTAWELPAYYHNLFGKNLDTGRLAYSMQTYNVRVMNYLYEKAGKDIRSGDARKFARGVRNLLGITATLTVANIGTQVLKGLISYAIQGAPEDKPAIDLKPEDIPMNMLNVLGMNQYDYQRMADGDLMKSLIESKLPPVVRIADDIADRPDRATRYIPIIGRPLYEYWKGHELFGMQSRDAARKEHNKEYGYRININVPAKDEGTRSRSERKSRGSRER